MENFLYILTATKEPSVLLTYPTLQTLKIPDSRSEKKGVEMEGISTASFNGIPFIFVGSERGNFIEVWQADNPKEPKWIQNLPTGIAPEGIITISSRSDGKNLLVSANEKEGSITLYQFYPEGAPSNQNEPQIRSIGYNIPWSALSGLCSDESTIYAIPNNAFKQSRIFHINPKDVQKGQMLIEKVTLLTEKKMASHYKLIQKALPLSPMEDFGLPQKAKQWPKMNLFV
jgi:hypothetical protein